MQEASVVLIKVHMVPGSGASSVHYVGCKVLGKDASVRQEVQLEFPVCVRWREEEREAMVRDCVRADYFIRSTVVLEAHVSKKKSVCGGEDGNKGTKSKLQFRSKIARSVERLCK